jgi:hypothetical protein
MSKVVKFLEPCGNAGSRNKKTYSGIPLVSQLVENSRQTFAVALVGRSMIKDRLGNLEILFFYDDKPHQGRATSCTHPCRVNLGPVQNAPSTQIR